MSQSLTPLAHHVIQAYRSWFLENFPVVHIHVNAAELLDPSLKQMANDDVLTLSIGDAATPNFHIDAEHIRFTARFGGVARDICVPNSAVMAMCGLTTDGQMTQLFPIPHLGEQTPESPEAEPKRKPSLSVVK